MVKGAADIADDDPLDVAIEKLRDCCPAEAVADLLGLATGVLEAVHGERSQQEIAWAAREWAQLMAQTQPLVLVFEDIHWAEEPLLELIEHMTAWVREGSLLILCLARPELLDVRSDWGGGRVRATSIELEPLGEADSEQLDRRAERDGDVSPATRRALLEKTGAIRSSSRRSCSSWPSAGEEEAAEGIPDTLQALIAARIDRLAPESKALLQRASVSAAGSGAARSRPRAGRRASTRRSRICCSATSSSSESRSSLSDETRLPLQARPDPRRRLREPHEIGAGGASRELRATGSASARATSCSRSARYHLDHAASLLADLDGAPPAELAREAAETLEEAGRRALAREANQAARNSFLRASSSSRPSSAGTSLRRRRGASTTCRPWRARWRRFARRPCGPATGPSKERL